MLHIGKTILDGAILSVIASVFLVAVLRFNPRLFLQDYPEDIRKQVSPKTEKEKRQSLIVGIPFPSVCYWHASFDSCRVGDSRHCDISFVRRLSSEPLARQATWPHCDTLC